MIVRRLGLLAVGRLGARRRAGERPRPVGALSPNLAAAPGSGGAGSACPDDAGARTTTGTAQGKASRGRLAGSIFPVDPSA